MRSIGSNQVGWVKSVVGGVALAGALVACSSGTADAPHAANEPDAGMVGHEGDGDDAAAPARDASASDGAAALTTEKTGCDGVDLEPPAPGAGVQFKFEMDLAPGEEREMCQLVKLDSDINVNWTDGVFTKGSHHGQINRTNYQDSIPAVTLDGQTLDGTKPHVCSTVTALWDASTPIVGGHPVGGGQNQMLAKGMLPSDVAVRFKKGEFVAVNFHMLNPTQKPITGCYKANLNGVPDAQVKQEAGILFWYNPTIAIPASSKATARVACPITQDIHLSSAVSHAHSRLDHFVSTLVDGDPGAGGKVLQTLYEGNAWDVPTPTTFPTPIAVKKGQWIDYQCDYTNREDRNVAQGFQTTDEMCMFIGSYWPRNPELDWCAPNPVHSAVGGRAFFTGTKTGADFLSCYWHSPLTQVGGGAATSEARYATNKCMTDTCPKASGAVDPYLACLALNSNSCKNQCTTTQSSFQAICANTPATSATSKDGCKAEYGTDGTNGTCAKTGTDAGVKACTTAAQSFELSKQCSQTLCSAACGGDAGASPACQACVGAFNGDPNNKSCLNQLTLACVQDQAKTATTACATSCFTDCITTRVTSCTLDCLNSVSCKNEYAALGAATCN